VKSSAAAGDASGLTGIGFAPNSTLGLTTFRGITGLTPADILVRYTYYGDSDLNGKVNLDDFSVFLQGFQNAGASWLVGDYDYNGAVTLGDFGQFCTAFKNQGAPIP
jgi:hypothetical protein